MHKLLSGTRQNPVIYKDIFFDGQARVAGLQITRVIVGYTMAERQILCA